MSPERFFAAASLLFGAIMIVLTPPFQTPDEPAHLFRIWSISEGRLFGRGGAPVPRSLVAAAATALERPYFDRTPLRPHDRFFVPVVADSWRQRLSYTAPSSTPFGYAVTAAAIFLGRLLELSPVALVYLGRGANLAASTLILAVAIRRAPFGRWALALFALTPMVVYMRATLSVDALTIACAAALVVELLRGQAWSSIALSFLVAAIKPGYVLLPLLALGVPRLRARRAVAAMIAIAMMAGVAAGWLWSREAGTPNGPTLGGAAALLRSPVAYALDLPRELAKIAPLLAIELVADFGWLDAPAPLAFALIWIAALAGVAVIDGPASGFSRTWSLALFFATAAIITTVFHVFAQPHEFFTGLQGRYFLPALPLVLLPLGARRTSEIVKRRAVVVFTVLAVAQSSLTLAWRYYWL